MVQFLPILLGMSLGLPPLSDDQVDRLARAVDGVEHREDAFAALVENVRQWTGELGDAPIRLRPDFGAMLDNPSAFRGDLCRIEGIIAQQSTLAPPFEDVREWFVRAPDGLPVVVYVAQVGSGQFLDGQWIEIDARLYKRIGFVARDGQRRSSPAFIGAFPRLIEAPVAAAGAGDPSGRLWLVAGPILAMLLVFAGLLIYARRKRAGPIHATPGRAHIDRTDHAEVDIGASLPDDPAAALAELKRRAGGGEHASTHADH